MEFILTKNFVWNELHHAYEVHLDQFFLPSCTSSGLWSSSWPNFFAELLFIGLMKFILTKFFCRVALHQAYEVHLDQFFLPSCTSSGLWSSSWPIFFAELYFIGLMKFILTKYFISVEPKSYNIFLSFINITYVKSFFK